MLNKKQKKEKMDLNKWWQLPSDNKRTKTW